MTAKLFLKKLKKLYINILQIKTRRNSKENLPMAYDILCGVKEPINLLVYKLDKRYDLLLNN